MRITQDGKKRFSLIRSDAYFPEWKPACRAQNGTLPSWGDLANNTFLCNADKLNDRPFVVGKKYLRTTTYLEIVASHALMFCKQILLCEASCKERLLIVLCKVPAKRARL